MIENKNNSFDDIIIDGIKYDLFHADRTATVSLNQHIRYNVVIPEFVSYQGNNYSVTAIADMAFHACRVVKSITLPNTIKSIGTHAFGKCSSLENCIIPNSVEVIKDYAFCSCTSLHSLSIPQNVKKIFPFAFYGCYALQISVDKENPIYDSRDNCNAIIETSTNIARFVNKNTILPKSVTMSDECIHEMHEMSIEHIDFLAIRELNSLAYYGIKTLGQLVKLTHDDLLKHRTLKRLPITELDEWLADKGLFLGMKNPIMEKYAL